LQKKKKNKQTNTKNTEVKRKQPVESSSEDELCGASITFLVIKATQILMNWHTVNKMKNKMLFSPTREADFSSFCHEENKETLHTCHFVCKGGYEQFCAYFTIKR
jgi:hypothetical protein